jgi:lipid-binding SYLF domain-containing protein
MTHPVLRNWLPIGALAVLATSALVGCSTIPVEEREQVRQEVTAATNEALAAFKAEDPDVEREIESSPGYIVATGTDLLIGLIGRGDTTGILHDRTDNTRTFVNIDEFAFGLGVGASDVQILAILNDVDTVDSFKRNRWIPSGDLMSVAGEAGGVAQWISDEMSVRARSQSGAEVGANLRLARVSVNTELSDRQNENAPRVWTRTLPFLGQKVVDKGYDLPLPIGLGVTYVDINQDLELTDLFVGFNGGDLEGFDFVSFENSNSDTRSFQLKVDAWLFPFLNVFGMYGKVDGSVDLDVFLDGNLILDRRGTDCSRPLVRPPLCDALEDQVISFPVRAGVDVETWGFGTVLAGGWKGWFATIPISVTYAEPKDRVADGSSLTVTPRFGRLLDLGNLGSMAVFVGGNYLDSDVTIDGSFTFPGNEIPALEGLTLDYRIDEQNTDHWNIVTGFNWDISKRLSWSAEYNGFTGSREAFISSLNLRF